MFNIIINSSKVLPTTIFNEKYSRPCFRASMLFVILPLSYLIFYNSTHKQLKTMLGKIEDRKKNKVAETLFQIGNPVEHKKIFNLFFHSHIILDIKRGKKILYTNKMLLLFSFYFYVSTMHLSNIFIGINIHTNPLEGHNTALQTGKSRFSVFRLRASSC